MKKLFIFTIVLIIIYNQSYAQESMYDASIRHVMSTLNCDQNYAKWVISIIDDFSKKIQSNIEYIANSNESYSSKTAVISVVINDCFESKFSEVDVSNNSSTKISTYYIYEYLTRLAKIKTSYGYTKVELLFNPDYLGLGTFNKTSETTYELSITMWQIFRAWYGDQITYSDATRKKFRLNFYVNKNNEVENIRVNRIFVAETIDLNKYNRNIK